MGLILRKFICTLSKPDSPEFGAREFTPWNNDLLNAAEDLLQRKINTVELKIINDNEWEISYTKDSEKLLMHLLKTDEFHEFGGVNKKCEVERFPKPTRFKVK